MGAGIGRVIDELRGVIGAEVGVAGDSAHLVLVGTERDLPGLPALDLAVAIDADAVILAPHYRAEEARVTEPSSKLQCHRIRLLQR